MRDLEVFLSLCLRVMEVPRPQTLVTSLMQGQEGTNSLLISLFYMFSLAIRQIAKWTALDTALALCSFLIIFVPTVRQP